MGGFILEKDRAKVPDRCQLGAWDMTALRYVRYGRALCFASNARMEGLGTRLASYSINLNY